MTNNEIIAILDCYKSIEDQRTEELSYHGYNNSKEAKRRKEALDDAIKILSVPERKKGKWDKDGNLDNWYACSKCGQVIYSESAEDRKEFWAFCSRCGADMRGGKE